MEAESSTAAQQQSMLQAPLLLDQLKTLIAAASTPLSSANLHPYASLLYNNLSSPSLKGKGKAVDHHSVPSLKAQTEAVRQLGEALDQARAVLGSRNGDWSRLSRSLREIVSNQAASVALRHPSWASGSSGPLIPSSRISLQPVELLQHLASKLDIQTYLEDSQFGLLKTSLTLAGNCFVIDIDLETDPVLGANGEVDGADGDAEAGDDEQPPSTAAAATIDKARTEGRGRVRASKLTATHVTAEGGTGKSDYLAAALLHGVDAYLVVWNESALAGDVEAEWERAKRLEEQVRHLEIMLGEVKGLDDAPGAFVELEAVGKAVNNWFKGDGPIRVYACAAPCVLPLFCLLPDTGLGADPQNLEFCLRPALQGESVLTPFAQFNGADEPMDDHWPGKDWILECKGRPSTATGGHGLVVRRGWLGAETKEAPWDGGVKVETVLYAQSKTSGPAAVDLQPFPYNAGFRHSPASTADDSRDRAMHFWSMGRPGPDAFVIGRIGVSCATDGLSRIIEALRTQVVLNCAFSGVFRSTALASQTGSMGDDDDADDLDTLLSGPAGLAVDVTLEQKAVLVDFPVATEQHAADKTTLWLRVEPSPEGPYLRIVVSGDTGQDVQAAVQAALDERKPNTLIEMVRVASEVCRVDAMSVQT